MRRRVMVRRPKYLMPVRDGQRWLISYTDVLTLLLILFVAIAAQAVSKTETRVAAAAPPVQVQTPPEKPVSAPPPVPVELPADKLKQTEARLKAQGLDAKREERGLVISLPQAVLFASGDDRINVSAYPIISEIAGAVRDLDNKIELSGHADSIPIHNRRFKNNWELSSARGLSLLNTLTRDYGISESRLSVSSHGSFSPKTSNDTADGRAENRRVEILILDRT